MNVLITGCSSGIGFACAKQLRQSGHGVFAVVRKEEDVTKLQDLGCVVYNLDVTHRGKVDAMFADLKQQGVGLDVVFNNAGYGQPGALEDVTVEVLKQQFETNVFGLFYITQKAAAYMKAQKSGGKILQHGSILGLVSLAYRGAYNASKYALEGLNDTLRLELAGSGVQIATVNTGPVRSRFRHNAMKMFEANIDQKNSDYAQVYSKKVAKRLHAKDSGDIWTLDSREAARQIVAIMGKKRVQPRYYITKAAAILAFVKRLCS
ncbi:MAG: SDR family NAD(P)-dependent oxidoreductase, partial [Campylobacterota bacterium]